MTRALTPLRVLLTEGSSTSAREAVTLLGRQGHHVEVCDPDRHCLARFSRHTARLHAVPGMGLDPGGFLEALAEILGKGVFDVLLPIHEQGYLIAHAGDRLRQFAAFALPDARTYGRVLDKSRFAEVLRETALPQPEMRVARSAGEIETIGEGPVVLKLPVATASRGVWIVDAPAALEPVLARLDELCAYERGVIVQEFVRGALGHVQAVFDNGALVAVHGYRQLAAGAGGGPSRKVSDTPGDVAEHVTGLGRHLHWHGALSLDYVRDERDGLPKYIDGNPRLVEPMSAALAGTDLMGALLGVTLETDPERLSAAPDGVATHLSLQVLLGAALGSRSRRAVLSEAWQLIRGSGPYAQSSEELTPVRGDLRAALPVLGAAVALIANPVAAGGLATRGWGRHLLTPKALKFIAEAFER